MSDLKVCDMKENWYALLVAILQQDMSVDEAVRLMGLGRAVDVCEV